MRLQLRLALAAGIAAAVSVLAVLGVAYYVVCQRAGSVVGRRRAAWRDKARRHGACPCRGMAARPGGEAGLRVLICGCWIIL